MACVVLDSVCTLVDYHTVEIKSSQANCSMDVLGPQDEEGQVTDMISFYTLPSTVMHHAVHKQLKAAYSFYNVCHKTPLIDLMQDALILAKQVRK